jgi:3-hydroxymyristoyl/3-hydroxydecanoyl-(acyl carrier protein) dehydratase
MQHLLERLPQQPPFRFVTQLIELDPGRRAVGLVRFGAQIDSLGPTALLPPELLLEAAAQVGLLIGDDGPSTEQLDLLAEVPRFTWERPITGADPCLIAVTTTLKRGPWVRQAVEVRVDGSLVGYGALTGCTVPLSTEPAP